MSDALEALSAELADLTDDFIGGHVVLPLELFERIRAALSPQREEVLVSANQLEDRLSDWIIDARKHVSRCLVEIGPVNANTPEDIKAGRVAAYQYGYQVGRESALVDAIYIIYPVFQGKSLPEDWKGAISAQGSGNGLSGLPQGYAAPPHSLPSWSECAIRVDNSNFIDKRVAEGGYGAEDDALLASELHRFIYEYADADPFRNGWFMHRLEKLVNELRLDRAPKGFGEVDPTIKPKQDRVDALILQLRNAGKPYPKTSGGLCLTHERLDAVIASCEKALGS